MSSWNILLIDCIAITIVHSGIWRPVRNIANSVFKTNFVQFKPLSCCFCMGFWIGIFYFPLTFEGIGLACACAFTSELIYRLFKFIPVGI